MRTDAVDHGLRFGPLGPRAVHLCVDMQNMFAERTEWHAPAMAGVLPNVEGIVRRDPARTIFTRFVPPREAAETEGAWRRYYERWHAMTLRELDPAMVELMPPLGRYVPPAEVFDKSTYSPWVHGDLDGRLRRRGVDTLGITGGETDVCVLGAVMGGIDRGYRAVIVADALCSASDEAHEAAMMIFRSRYDRQIETVTTQDLLDEWR